MNDLDAAVKVMTQAFFDDPLWTYLVPDHGMRDKWLFRFYRVFIQRAIESMEAFGIGEPPCGVTIWVFAHQGDDWAARPSEIAYLRLLSDPLFSTTSTAASLFSMLDEIQKCHVPGPHLYLSSIGVAAEARGRGLASKLIEPFLAMADALSLPSFTETFKPPNVGVFEHFGFRVVEKQEVPGSPLTIWALMRAPRSKAE